MKKLGTRLVKVGNGDTLLRLRLWLRLFELPVPEQLESLIAMTQPGKRGNLKIVGSLTMADVERIKRVEC